MRTAHWSAAHWPSCAAAAATAVTRHSPPLALTFDALLCPHPSHLRRGTWSWLGRPLNQEGKETQPPRKAPPTLAAVVEDLLRDLRSSDRMRLIKAALGRRDTSAALPPYLREGAPFPGGFANLVVQLDLVGSRQCVTNIQSVCTAGSGGWSRLEA